MFSAHFLLSHPFGDTAQPEAIVGGPYTEQEAAEALERAGAIIVAVATVVDRDTGAQKVIEDAGYRYLTAVTLDDLGLR